MNNLTLLEIDRRVAAAQRLALDLDQCTSDKVKSLVKLHANTIGCPVEFMFMPLLTLTSHFMGPDTRVKVKDGWEEPPIIWTVVLADKGQKKSAALNRFLKPIQQIEESLQQPSEEEQEDNGNPAQQVYIEHFSMEELHYTLKRNNGRVVGLYDEVSLLYEQLDKYRNGSSDRKTLLSLINGSPWRRNFRNSNSVVPKTWFNLAGFVQPDVIVNLLHGNDYDGFLDRQFFVCPPEVDTDYDDMKDMPQDATSFKEMFHIIDDNHTTDSLYTLDDNAKLEFVAFHDEINERKRKEHRRDRDRKSVLSKAKGQVLRLAAVGFALHQAICTAEDPSIQWQYTITKDHMLKAIYLVNFLIEQKFSLGKEKHSVTESTAESDVPSDLHRMKRLLELSSPVTVAKISQNHIQRRVDKKYRKEEAIDLMEEAAKYDLATVVTEKYNAGRNERLKKELRKRTADNLTDKSKDILKRMKVDMDKYFT